jgi:hypothetical protein
MLKALGAKERTTSMLKIALVAFQGDPMCFAHVMWNALDMQQRGFQVVIIFEGMATKLLLNLVQPDNLFHGLYVKVKEAGLIEGVCRACATKTGSLAEAQAQGLRLLDELNGHPSLGRYLEAGFQVLTF